MSLELALELKKKGRGPDTELVHMTKGEVAGLNRLARHVYGQKLPINPETGLYEAGWLKSLLPTIVGGAVSYYTGSSGAGAAAGALTGAATNKGNRLEGAVTGGIAGYGGGQLGAALAGQGGISSLGTMQGWQDLMGKAEVKDAKGNVTTPATGLGGGMGALKAVGMGAAPLLLDMGGGGGGKSSAPSASSIMQDPNAPASYRLKRMYVGNAPQPAGGSASSERQWFRDVYEPNPAFHGAEGGEVTSQKMLDYLHRRGTLDKPGGGAGVDTGGGAGDGTTPPVDDSGGPQPQIKQKPPTAEPVRHGAGNNPIPDSIRKRIEEDSQGGRYYDPAKLIAAYEATPEGKDKRTVLKDDAWKSALKPIEGLKQVAGYTKWDARNDLEGGGGTPAGEDFGYYKDKYGQKFNTYKEPGDDNIYLKYSDNNGDGFRNVTGSKHDKVQPTYRLDPATGTAVPVNANTRYDPGAWVDYGRDLAKLAAVMGTVGVAGTALAAAGGIEGLAAGAGAAGAGTGTTAGSTMAEAMTAGAGGTGGVASGGAAAGAGAGAGAGGSGIGGALTSAYNAASPYLKYAQTGLSALNAMKGQPKGSAPAGDAANDYVPPEGAGAYGGTNLFAKPPKKAEGGVVGLQSGGFVFPADVVSAIGAGSSSAGLETLAKKFGATPVSGTGHGQSDDVHALIDGEQAARVARDEAVLDKEQVAAIGGGDPKKGAKKLYALMDRVRKQSMGRTKQMRPVKLKELA